MEEKAFVSAWRTVLAFAVIYLIWGSTFLAVRIGVQEVPPFLFASMRFLAAGLALFGWMVVAGEDAPTLRTWTAALLPSVLMFVLDYGLLFWAEQRVPSGIAAVMMGTIPAFMALSEIIILKTQKATVRLALALAMGTGGVVVLMSPSLSLGGRPVDALGAIALITGAASWSLASVLMRRRPLPGSRAMVSGVQMLLGGLLLAITAVMRGELTDFHPMSVSRGAWLSLLYLVVPGSIVGFTAYIWLIHRESPTKVGTYAYVNPVVAVIVGYVLGGEYLGVRTGLGTLFVLISVIVITTTQPNKPLIA